MTLKSYISTKDLTKIKNLLPRGSVKRIAEELSVDISTVSKVLNGRFNNQSVIELAIKIIEDSKSENTELKKRIKNL